jgi:hypothetical protein
MNMPLVLPDDAGLRDIKPGVCFYCHSPIGTPHGERCVCVKKRVRMKYTFTVEVDVPFCWDGPETEDYYNDHSCATNRIDEVEDFARSLPDATHDDSGVGCLCNYFECEFIEVVDPTPRNKREAPRFGDHHAEPGEQLMTREQIANIEAGPECDKAVAEACFGNATIYFDHDLQQNVCLLLPGDVRFSPSTDLNDAFDAAERFGLFDPSRHGFSISQNGRGEGTPRTWWIFDPITWVKHADGIVVDDCDTAPLAICKAILILKAESP